MLRDILLLRSGRLTFKSALLSVRFKLWPLWITLRAFTHFESGLSVAHGVGVVADGSRGGRLPLSGGTAVTAQNALDPELLLPKV